MAAFFTSIPYVGVAHKIQVLTEIPFLGLYDSDRMECRTEERTIGRNPDKGYPNVGFLIVREDRVGLNRGE